IGTALAAAGFKASTSVADDMLGAFTAPEMADPAPAQPSGFNYDYGTANAAPRYAAPASSQFSGLREPSARFDDVAAPALTDFPLGTARAQMFDNYIIAQNDTGLLLVDQHAAHERLVYERFKAQLASGPVASQAQLIPVIVELPEEDC